MFAVLNVDTGDFYSESPALKNEAKRAGRRWDNTSILAVLRAPLFALPRSIEAFPAAIQCNALHLCRGNHRGVWRVKHIREVLAELCAERSFSSASQQPVAPLDTFTAGRDSAPSGVPTQLHRVGGEGTRLRGARGAVAVFRYCGSQFFQFFAQPLRPPFFVASVVAPPESLIDETAPQKTGGALGY